MRESCHFATKKASNISTSLAPRLLSLKLATLTQNRPPLPHRQSNDEPVRGACSPWPSFRWTPAKAPARLGRSERSFNLGTLRRPANPIPFRGVRFEAVELRFQPRDPQRPFEDDLNVSYSFHHGDIRRMRREFLTEHFAQCSICRDTKSRATSLPSKNRRIAADSIVDKNGVVPAGGFIVFLQLAAQSPGFAANN